MNPSLDEVERVVGLSGDPIWLFADWAQSESLDIASYVQSIERSEHPAGPEQGPRLVRDGEMLAFGQLAVGFSAWDRHELMGDKFNLKLPVEEPALRAADMVLYRCTTEVGIGKPIKRVVQVNEKPAVMTCKAST